MIHVLFVDDHHVIRKGKRYLLEATPDIQVVDITHNEFEAIQQARLFHPHVTILDICKWSWNHEAAPSLLFRISGPGALLFDHPEYVQRALEAGVHGYVLKSRISGDLIDAVRAINNGKRFF